MTMIIAGSPVAATLKIKTCLFIPLFFISLFVFSSCASEKPMLTMADAETSLQRAREAKAADYAPLELTQAEERMRSARQAMYNEDYTEARRLAQEAQVRANLAEARSRSVQTQKATQEIRQSVEALRRDLGSNADMSVQ